MQPMYLALIFVTLASFAIVAVKYAARLKRQPALAEGAAQRLTRSVEGSLVVPVRVPAKLAARLKSGQQALTEAARQEQATALDQKVDDTIRRLILMN